MPCEIKRGPGMGVYPVGHSAEVFRMNIKADADSKVAAEGASCGRIGPRMVSPQNPGGSVRPWDFTTTASRSEGHPT
jgi:hypothetical protein